MRGKHVVSTSGSCLRGPVLRDERRGESVKKNRQHGRAPRFDGVDVTHWFDDVDFTCD
jgi:hypothetical protein